MRRILLVSILLSEFIMNVQQRSGVRQFWDTLKSHCGKDYEHKLVPHVTNDDLSEKKLTIYVRTCDDGTITIPFYVGEDRSRTWVLTFENDRIKLKHDHRHEDGTEDTITQYGGTNTNSGLPGLQFFPADSETAELIG